LTKLIFVRHGMTRENIDYTLIGRTDPPLHPIGIMQARAVADTLSHRALSAIVSSPLRRALETAALIAVPHRLTVTTLHELTEIDLGIVDGLSSFTAYDQYPALMDEALNPSLHDFAFPNGESRTDALHRFQSAIQQLVRQYPNGTICVVTHGGPLGLWLADIHQQPLGSFRSWQPQHGAITQVTWCDEVYRVDSLNQTEHLPNDLEILIDQARECLP
jgi:broad specificity phosphatase PhoE